MQASVIELGGSEAGAACADCWQRLAAAVGEWLQAQGLAARDAIVLLPFAQHIGPARRAFAARPGWAPQLTTSRSLASSLGPTLLAAPGQISLDAAMDAFTADALLAGQSWAQQLREQSDAAYLAARAQMVETAYLLARGAAQRPPGQRAAWFEQVRQRLQAVSGPGELERALGLVALAWVMADDRPAPTDTLFTLRPSAWIVLEAGGPDPLAEALMTGDVPALRLVADFDLAPGLAPAGSLDLALCDDFEALAEATATAVLQHLNAGRAPVALLAQDRVVVRRVRALLGRQGVPVLDETGWTLATTPAAAALMALLRANLGQAAMDDWLAWLKSPLTSGWEPEPLASLEALCRRKGWRQPERLDLLDLPVWHRARDLTAPLRGGPRKLGAWLADLGRVLRALAPLSAVEGGVPLLEALWVSRNPWEGSAHEALIGATRLSPAEFLAWVDATLEAAQFSAEPGHQAAVVITPMARALLRPFGVVVLPGADAATLAAPVPRLGVLSDADAQQLGLPHAAAERAAQAKAFAQLLRSPALTLLRCRFAGVEPLPASPLLDQLQAALGHPLPAWQDERTLQPLKRAAPTTRRAAAPARLPAALSATGIDALRNCPYQFFAGQVLGLRPADEIDTEADKRDYGTWLHAVLHRFHEQRRDLPGQDDTALLRAAADAELQSLDEADFLPYRAGFERLMPRYLAWLAQTESVGQHYEAGELTQRQQPFDGPLADLVLQGRIDRIDTTPQGRLLLDYKTGRASDLSAKVKAPLEDTQLAVYALLAPDGPGLQAAYLALDEPEALKLVTHPDVAQSAAQLRDALQQELSDILAGAALPALGEGRLCEHCDMRGLCRKDDQA